MFVLVGMLVAILDARVCGTACLGTTVWLKAARWLHGTAGFLGTAGSFGSCAGWIEVAAVMAKTGIGDRCECTKNERQSDCETAEQT